MSNWLLTELNKTNLNNNQKFYLVSFMQKHKLFSIAFFDDEVINLGDYYFTINDIVFDIETNQPEKNIITWHNNCLDYYQKNNEFLNQTYKDFCIK